MGGYGWIWVDIGEYEQICVDTGRSCGCIYKRVARELEGAGVVRCLKRI